MVLANNRGYEPTVIMQFHSGLWKFCQSNPAATGGGSRSGFCQSYHVPITQLPPYLLFQRALMVLSVLFGTIAMIVAFCATDSVNAGEFFAIKSSSFKLI